MKTNNRIIRLILAVILCVIQIPLFVHAQSAPTPIALGDLSATQSGEGWTYDHDATLLLLGSGEFALSGEFNGTIKVATDSVILIQNGSTVTLGANSTVDCDTVGKARIVIEEGATLTNGGTITSAIKQIDCAGKLSGSGNTNCTVNLTGTIESGTYGGGVYIMPGGTIKNGQFNYIVNVQGGTIEGGNFSKEDPDKIPNVSMTSGEISGGTFECTVWNPYTDPFFSDQSTGVISGGTFKQRVDNANGGLITGGTFEGTLVNGVGGIINIPEGSAVTIAPDATLTNDSTIDATDGGKLINNGTVTNNGTIMISRKKEFPISGEGGIVNNGNLYHVNPSIEIGDANGYFYYTGAVIPVEATFHQYTYGRNDMTFVGSPEHLNGENWSIVGYEKDGEPITKDEVKDEGHYTVTYRYKDTSIEQQAHVFIFQSGTAFSPLKTYLGTAEQTAFTYGDTITVKWTVSATGEAPVAAARLMTFAAPAAGQVAIFDENGNQLTEPQTAVSGEELTFYINGLGAGEYTLTAKYIESDNMAAAEGSAQVTVSKKTITPTVTVTLDHDIYTGYNLSPDVSVKDGDTPLAESDYTLIFKDANGEPIDVADIINAGTYTAVVTATEGGNYIFTEATVNFTVLPQRVGISVSVNVAGSNAVYAGVQLTPPVEVCTTASASPVMLVENRDYILTYGENLHAGAGSLTVEPIEGSNYTFDAYSDRFTIRQKEVTPTVLVGGMYFYNGSAHKPSGANVAVTDADGLRLIEGRDYTITYGENIHVGDGALTVTAIETGNFVFEPVPVSFPILRQILTPTVTFVNGESYVYTGSQITPAVSVAIGEKTLSAGTDYTISYGTNIDAGKGYVYIRQANADKILFEPIIAEFAITQKATEVTVSVSGTYAYTGSPILPDVKNISVKTEDGIVLVGKVSENDGVNVYDYMLSFGENISAGTGTIIITPSEDTNYAFDMIEHEFPIQRATVTGERVIETIEKTAVTSTAKVADFLLSKTGGTFALVSSEGVNKESLEVGINEGVVTYGFKDGATVVCGITTVTLTYDADGEEADDYAPLTLTITVSVTGSALTVTANDYNGEYTGQTILASPCVNLPEGFYGSVSWMDSTGTTLVDAPKNVSDSGLYCVRVMPTGESPIIIPVNVTITPKTLNIIPTVNTVNGAVTLGGVDFTLPGGWPAAMVDLQWTDGKETIVEKGRSYNAWWIDPSGNYAPVETNYTPWPAEDPGKATITSESVTIENGVAEIDAGGSYQFLATFNDGKTHEVTWSVEGMGYATGTFIDANGLLTVGKNETSESVYLKALPVDALTPNNLGQLTLTIKTTPAEITGISVSPTTAQLMQGDTLQFERTVHMIGTIDGAIQWTISGQKSADTKMEGPILTIGADEPEGTIIITATSHIDPTKFTTASITVLASGYEFTATAGEGGTISPASGVVAKGENAVFTISPDAGYVLEKLTLDGDDVTSAVVNGQYTISNVQAAHSLKATFKRITTYFVSTSASPAVGGSVAGGGLLLENTLITVEASANAGYRFVEWQEGGVRVSTDASYSFLVSADRDLVAVFADNTLSPAKHSITVQTNGRGSAYASHISAEQGKKITLTATPAEGYRFVRWDVISGDVSISRYDTFTMPDHAVTVEAVFEKDTQPPARNSISVQTEGKGTASSSHSSAAQGARITLTATPAAGYRFVRWVVVSGDVTIGSDNSFTMPNAAVTIKAVFEADASLHTHDWASKWSNNATHHWHECLESDCPISAAEQKNGYGAHDGALTGVCSCGYLMETALLMTVIKQTDIAVVPEGLKQTEFDTVEKIEEQLTRVLTTNTGYTAENIMTFDVTLQFSIDGGDTWINATEENFPVEGITVSIPYPAGTGKDTHDFVITHMFTVTSEKLGTVAGQTEQPAVTKLDNKMVVTLKGLSPLGVAWKSIESAESFTMTATADANGKITPESASVERGASVGFTITPNSGYELNTLTLDGTDVTAQVVYGAYILSDVQASHTLHATFKPTETTLSAPVIQTPTSETTIEVYVGDSAELSVTAMNAVSYQWYVDRGNGWEPVGENSPTYTTGEVSLASDGEMYYCMVSGEEGTAPASSSVFKLSVTEIAHPSGSGNLVWWIVIPVIIIAALAGCGIVLYQRRKKN